VTSSDIKRICFEYCDSNGIPNQFNQEKRMASDDWYYGFLKRHPDVRMGKSGSSTNPKSDESSGGKKIFFFGRRVLLSLNHENNRGLS
jgi:hypothetical protein